MIGDAAVKLMLRNVAERVPDRARKTMHKYADLIVADAKLFVPVDTHNLEESIHKVVSYGFRGRLQIDIEAGGFINGVDVDEYALMIHENYEALHPGAGTAAKRLANPGVYIGSKYLERAYEKHIDALRADMIVAINEGIAEANP